jgi:hypothetical protein
MRLISTSMAAVGVLGLAACAVQPPEGPSFAAMPGTGKTYDQFQADNYRCQQIARQAAGPVSPSQAGTDSAVGSTVAGTAIGAAGGALLGAAAGNAGVGAAIGAGAGLLAGSAVGANNAQASSAGLQRVYDINYAQCMAAAGEKVPDMTGSNGPGYPPPPPYPASYAYPPYPYAYPAYAPGYYYPPVEVGIGFGYYRGYGWHRHW